MCTCLDAKVGSSSQPGHQQYSSTCENGTGSGVDHSHTGTELQGQSGAEVAWPATLGSWVHLLTSPDFVWKQGLYRRSQVRWGHAGREQVPKSLTSLHKRKEGIQSPAPQKQQTRREGDLEKTQELGTLKEPPCCSSSVFGDSWAISWGPSALQSLKRVPSRLTLWGCRGVAHIPAVSALCLSPARSAVGAHRECPAKAWHMALTLAVVVQ